MIKKFGIPIMFTQAARSTAAAPDMSHLANGDVTQDIDSISALSLGAVTRDCRTIRNGTVGPT